MCGFQVYGEDVAILTGDALLCRAFELVAATENVPPTAIVQASFSHCCCRAHVICSQDMMMTQLLLSLRSSHHLCWA